MKTYLHFCSMRDNQNWSNTLIRVSNFWSPAHAVRDKFDDCQLSRRSCVHIFQWKMVQNITAPQVILNLPSRPLHRLLQNSKLLNDNFNEALYEFYQIRATKLYLYYPNAWYVALPWKLMPSSKVVLHMHSVSQKVTTWSMWPQMGHTGAGLSARITRIVWHCFKTADRYVLTAINLI